MQERTEWHRIVMFNRLAEIAGEYLKKGQQIYIEGKLQTREWEKDGIKRYTTEIVANEMQMLGGRSGGGGGGMSGGDEFGSMGGGMSGGGGQSRPAPQKQKPQQAESFGDMDDFGDDDIPF
ncbi:unnamed protein product [Cyprideis torosa]|uniref:Single-stranded DNA-binding protein n=1 Tax=Cyprideis torosa TaxID=163714 RepID=A0A7R8X2H7_9CRUS|nr:unnamed protein product [Cyprideis torosa]CAG0910865.1 unnamed protein product [Cyprideis torosa]